MTKKHLTNMAIVLFLSHQVTQCEQLAFYLLEMLAMPNLPIIKPTKQFFEIRVLWAQLIRVPVASFNTAVKRRFRPYINILWS